MTSTTTDAISIDRLLGKAGPQHTTWQQDVVYDQGKHGKPDGTNKHIWEPVRDRQEELRAAIDGGHRSLAAYLRRVLKIDGDDISAPPFPRQRLTTDEFQKPPPELEWELWQEWSDVTPRLASRPLFWLLCHIAWIEDGRLGRDGHGLALALTAGGSKRGLEAETRNFLRRTGGIPHERGKVSVFSDCPLARAWWRCRMATEVSDATDNTMSKEGAHLVLRENHQAWDRLAMLSVKNLVVVNQPSVRALVVALLQQRLRIQKKINDDDVKDVARECARRGLRRSLEYLPWTELIPVKSH